MMRRFRYRGWGGQGEPLKGSIVAEHKLQAAQKLTDAGCYLTMLRPQWSVSGLLPGYRPKLSASLLMPFCRQLGFMLSSGLPLLTALRLFGSEKSPPRLLDFSKQLVQALGAGRNLAEAMAMSGYDVPPMLLEFVLIGENRGTLDTAMLEAADYLDADLKLRNTILTALMYPALVLVIMVVAVVVMMAVMVPGLIQTYQNFDAPIPFLTQMLIGGSQWIGRYGGGLLLLGVGMIALLIMLRRRKGWVQVRLDQLARRVMLAVPLLRRLLRLSFFIRFSRSLGQLLEGGVLLLNSLKIIEKNDRGILFTAELAAISRAASYGKSLTESLKGCTFIPEMALQMIAVGEESGRLGDMLLHNSRYYSGEFNQLTMRLTKLVEPLLIVCLGMLVLLMAGSLFLPMISSYHYIL